MKTLRQLFGQAPYLGFLLALCFYILCFSLSTSFLGLSENGRYLQVALFVLALLLMGAVMWTTKGKDMRPVSTFRSLTAYLLLVGVLTGGKLYTYAQFSSLHLLPMILDFVLFLLVAGGIYVWLTSKLGEALQGHPFVQWVGALSLLLFIVNFNSAIPHNHHLYTITLFGSWLALLTSIHLFGNIAWEHHLKTSATLTGIGVIGKSNDSPQKVERTVLYLQLLNKILLGMWCGAVVVVLYIGFLLNPDLKRNLTFIKEGKHLVEQISLGQTIYEKDNLKGLYSIHPDHYFSFPAQYDDIKVENGLILHTQKDGLWGYVDVSIPIVFECQYLSPLSFNEDYQAIGKKEKFGVINMGGDEILPFAYEDIVFVSEHRICARKDGRWHAFSNSGQEISDIPHALEEELHQLRPQESLPLFSPSTHED